MTFETLGDKNNPAVLLIHGMISSGADQITSSRLVE